ncbi:MAG: DUF2252 family protein [Burkholderiales bacterium]
MRVDALREIQSFNAGRDPERLQLKYRAMRASPFAFLRGSCHLFYARLPRDGVFKSAPKVWSCGDLHLENFGSFKADNRLTYFDINDFDESALAPASWDLVRFLTSLHVGSATLSIGGSKAQKLCRCFLDAYGAALAGGKAYWVERDTSTGLVRTLLDDLRDRQREAFIDGRTVVKGKKRRLLADGKKALPASARQRDRVIEFMREFAEAQPNPEFYRVLDVARRIAGTGSLGVDRYAILVRGKGSGHNYLLDLKQTLPSSLLPRLKSVAQPKWASDAERVVALQSRLQAVPMAFLQAAQFNDAPYVLRALQPAEDRVRLDQTNGDMSVLEPLIATMGRIVAWAQLRSAGRGGSASADELIELGSRKKWKEQLIAASHECAGQVRKDAKAFDSAYDDGALAT